MARGFQLDDPDEACEDIFVRCETTDKNINNEDYMKGQEGSPAAVPISVPVLSCVRPGSLRSFSLSKPEGSSTIPNRAHDAVEIVSTTQMPSWDLRRVEGVENGSMHYRSMYYPTFDDSVACDVAGIALDLSLEGKLDDVTTTPNENPLNDALRALPPLRAPNLYAALVGVWEGVCLRYLIAGEAPTVVGPVLGVCRAVVYGLFRDGAEGGMVWAVVGESVGGGVGEGEREGREGKRRWKHSRSGSRGNGAGTSSARIQTSSAHSNQHPSPLPLPLPLSSFTTPPDQDQLQFQFQSKDPKDPGDDDLQTPLPQSRFLVSDDDDDDELQTPLALFPMISSLPVPPTVTSNSKH
ncbi:MAG: hypothetical protein NXY57DRAFT_1063505 [Lentinula lateritia]|nr:MAG: hypothetical protein NXY57DRAFT_1063505 [Lentinula lateritia]